MPSLAHLAPIELLLVLHYCSFSERLLLARVNRAALQAASSHPFAWAHLPPFLLTLFETAGVGPDNHRRCTRCELVARSRLMAHMPLKVVSRRHVFGECGMRQLLPLLPRIVYLDLAEATLKPEFAAQVWRGAGPPLNALKELYFSDSCFLTSADAEAMPSRIPRLNVLEFSPSDRCCRAIMPVLPRMEHLTSLCLLRAPAAEMQPLVRDSIAGCYGLRTLSLCMSYADVLPILCAPSLSSSLQTLVIWSGSSDSGSTPDPPSSAAGAGGAAGSVAAKLSWADVFANLPGLTELVFHWAHHIDAALAAMRTYSKQLRTVRLRAFYGASVAAAVPADDGDQNVGEAAVDPTGWFQTPTFAPLSALVHESSWTRLDSVRLHMEGYEDGEWANDLAPAALVQRRLLRDAYLTLAQQFGPRFQFMEEEA
jgi:hypothetical protein